MSLISLLIALAAERVMLSKYWHFNFYFARYLKFALGFVSKDEISKNLINITLLALIPALATYAVFSLVDNSLIEFVLSSLILIVCFGCRLSRQSYKNYLNAAMRGDEVAVTHHQMEIQQDQAEDVESYGQTLVWLNYQYYMAIMMVFIIFGAPGVVFYRLMVAIANNVAITDIDASVAEVNAAELNAVQPNADDSLSVNAETDPETDPAQEHELEQDPEQQSGNYLPTAAIEHARCFLFYFDFIPSRFAAFGYMLVGDFSKSSTLWLEGLLNYTMAPRKYLCQVAKTSEDCAVEEGDLIAEPTLLVRLAKRNVLLLLAATAFMTIAGVLS